MLANRLADSLFNDPRRVASQHMGNKYLWHATMRNDSDTSIITSPSNLQKCLGFSRVFFSNSIDFPHPKKAAVLLDGVAIGHTGDVVGHGTGLWVNFC